MAIAFNKWAVELDLKGLLSNGTVIAFSSFTKAEGKSFISHELVKAIALRDKKVLVVDVDGAMQVNTFPNYINLEKVAEKWQSLSVWQNMVNSWKENYDVIIIKNTPINDHPIAMQVMSSAVLNIVVLDSRKTKKVAIQNADLLKEELSLSNMQFVLNRDGYTPTIYTYAVEFVQKLSKLKK
jgi:cellulose biosynthesis protein BcsQ